MSDRKRPGPTALEGEERRLYRCDARVIVKLPAALRERLEEKAYPRSKAEYVRGLIERDLAAELAPAG